MIDLNGKELFLKSSNNNIKKNQQMQLNELSKGMMQLHSLQVKISKLLTILEGRIKRLEDG